MPTSRAGGTPTAASMACGLPRVPEECGWILNRDFGTLEITPRTAPLFRELCRKLVYLDPRARAVLLKNPFDTGNGEYLLREFPDARAILITRDPMETLGSQFEAFVTLASTENAYLELLYATYPFQKSFLKDIRRGIATSHPAPPASSLRGSRLSAKSFPVAERMAREVLSLPTGPHLATQHVQRIVTAANEVLETI